MRPLTRCVDSLFAARLQQALGAAGIASDVTSEIANAYLGSMEYVIWVDESADQSLIDSACAPILQSRAPDELALPETRVSAADEKLACRSCGYDLRGQVDHGNCPECGHPYHVVAQKKCPACNAEVPANFEVCWSCGGEIDPA